MKSIVRNANSIAAAVAAAFCAVAAQAAPLRVLAIGNSFSQSLCRHLPAAAAACGEELEFCNLYIGGCPLSRHAANIGEAAEKPGFAPYSVTWFAPGNAEAPRKFHSNIPQMLATQKWDIVTIQQASHESWNKSSYHPAADRVVAEIRRLAPQAEIVVHQTWAYNAADGRISGAAPKWGFGQSGMAERVEAAYADLAEGFGFRVIPVGRAVRLRREALAREGRGFGPGQVAALVPGQPVDLRGDPVGNLSWKKSKDGASTVVAGDTIHLNGRGQYLQAVTWLGFLFNLDVRDIPYAPEEKGLDAGEMAALRAAAAEALGKK